MLVQTGPELRQCLACILLAAPGLLLLAGDAVDHPGVTAVDGRVGGGHHIGHRGLDRIALLHEVAGGAGTTLPHTFTLSLWPCIWIQGRGHLGSDELLTK